MDDYISREDLIKRLNKNLYACNPGTFSESCYADAIETVINFPAADVEPVRHGRWGDNGVPDSMLRGCTVCEFSCGASSFRYCPNCGAKMDLEGERNG